MLFRARYGMIPGRLLPPGFGFTEADLCPPSRGFRMKIRTETRRGKIDETYSVTFVGAALRKEPPPGIAEIFADPEGFKKDHAESVPFMGSATG